MYSSTVNSTYKFNTIERLVDLWIQNKLQRAMLHIFHVHNNSYGSFNNRIISNLNSFVPKNKVHSKLEP